MVGLDGVVRGGVVRMRRAGEGWRRIEMAGTHVWREDDAEALYLRFQDGRITLVHRHFSVLDWVIIHEHDWHWWTSCVRVF